MNKSRKNKYVLITVEVDSGYDTYRATPTKSKEDTRSPRFPRGGHYFTGKISELKNKNYYNIPAIKQAVESLQRGALHNGYPIGIAFDDVV